jgi:hypothetical protein
MHRSSPFSLSRLRSSRRLWLLCVLTLLFKLATGSMCMADGVHIPSSTTTAVDVAVSDDGSDGDCVLGERGGCHCACSHSVPVPSSIAVVPPVVAVSSDWQVLSLPYAPTHVGVLLRPPIA